MVTAYKEHIQFIMILVFMYIMGVWVNPTIYIIFPVVLILLGFKKRYFELLVCAIWILILSDYVPVDNATYQDLQFAKDLKPLIPLTLFGFFLLDRKGFEPIPRFVFYFIPFLLVAIIALQYSIKIQVGIQKTISFGLMYFIVPVYVNKLHRDQGNFFWMSLFTFIIGMLTIGVMLGIAIPEIGILENTTRFKGIFGNPNGVGIFLNLTFIMWIVLEEFGMIKLTKKERWYTLMIILISVIWSGSRNGLMSIILFYSIFRLVKINWFIALIAVGSFIVFSDFVFEFIVELIGFFGLEGFFRLETLEEGSGRQIAWAFAWKEIQDYFFIGGGFGHDENIMRPNYDWLSRQGHEGGVHNSYLSLWFDTGVLGVVFYFGTLIRIVFYSMKHNYIVLAFIVSVMFNIIYESWLVGSLNPFTIILLIILTIFAQNLRGDGIVLENSSVTEEKKIATHAQA